MGRRPKLPRDADITIDATVWARQLRFDEVPKTRTEFGGAPGHESADGTDRVNLPRPVKKDVTYRHVRVDYRLASALRASAPSTRPTGPSNG